MILFFVFLDIVHFNSNAGSVSAIFLFPSHRFIVTKSVAYMLRPTITMGNIEEAFLVDSKNINNFAHSWYVYIIVTSFVGICRNNMWARNMKGWKFTQLHHFFGGRCWNDFSVDPCYDSQSHGPWNRIFDGKLHNIMFLGFNHLFYNPFIASKPTF